MTDKQIIQQIEAIKKASEKACKSKRSALKFLRDAGIIPKTKSNDTRSTTKR